MPSVIKLKRGSGAPTAGQLVEGEVALDLTNKRIYSENSSGTVLELGTNPTSLTTGAISGTTGTFTGGISGTTGTFSGAVTQEGNTVLDTADVGVSVQAYDADTAKLDVAQTYTAAQRGTVTTDNDLSFDMSATNFFKCTPTGTGTLTFTNITAGQSGNIWLDNSAAVVISAASTTYISAADLTKINSAGIYFLSYYSDGTNVMVSASSALTSAGA